MQHNILRYKRWEDRHASLLGKHLLLKAWSQRYNDVPALDRLQYTAYNRPYLDSGADFNISHAGEMVVCAIADNGQVGIDIEAAKPLDILAFQSLFNPEEWQHILDAPDRLLQFYQYWALKESVVKADGRGLSVPLKACVIHDHNWAMLENKHWQVQELHLASGYTCFVAFDYMQEIQLHAVDFPAQP